MKKLLSLGWLILSTHGLGTDWYAAPNGQISGAGTFTAPWSLQTALTQTANIRPGDVLYLRAGGYTGAFSATISGTPASPISIKPYAGEHAFINGTNVTAHVITVNGSNTV